MTRQVGEAAAGRRRVHRRPRSVWAAVWAAVCWAVVPRAVVPRAVALVLRWVPLWAPVWVPVSAPAALSAQVAGQPPLPAPVGYVNDFANVLEPEAAARLEALARRVQAATGGDMVVVTLPDLGGRPVEEVSLRLGREWKVGAADRIGEQSRNAGVIILVVPKERSTDGRGHCRIETGQGTEGFITDATSGAICRAAIPLFRDQRYSDALLQIGSEVAGRYAENFGVALDGVPAPERRRSRDRSPPVPWVLIVVILIWLLGGLGRRRRGCLPVPIPGPSIGGGWSGGGWSGGGFGGSSGGFGGFGGGGGFSGGGGGSDW